MNINEGLIKKLNQKFEPSALIRFRFRSKDVAVQTDSVGNAVKAFIGKSDENGTIRGDRYSRILVQDSNGKIIKDHWDRKGYAS